MQGENVVANMAKHHNNQLTLRALYVHAARTSIEDNEIMKNVQKVVCCRQHRQKNHDHGWQTNIARNMRRLRRVGGATLDSKNANLICLLLCAI